MDPQTGKRVAGGYEFHYNGLKQPIDDQSLWREEATRDNLFLPHRRAKLDAALLKKMGLTRKRMEEKDALFFLQLLLPIANPTKSGIDKDPRKPFYSDVQSYTNIYAMSPMCDQGGELGHLFNPTNSQELVCWNGVVVSNVNEFVGSSWNTRNENQYDPVISSTMTYSRWRQLKGNMKLCLFYEEKKRGDDGYDPTIKYRKVWDVATHNLNQFVERGGLDLTVDETTCVKWVLC